MKTVTMDEAQPVLFNRRAYIVDVNRFDQVVTYTESRLEYVWWFVKTWWLGGYYIPALEAWQRHVCSLFGHQLLFGLCQRCDYLTDELRFALLTGGTVRQRFPVNPDHWKHIDGITE